MRRYLVFVTAFVALCLSAAHLSVASAEPALAAADDADEAGADEADAADEADDADGADEADAAKTAEAERNFVASLTKLHGDVKLPSAKVTLHIPDKFYFLDAKDAQRVLTQAWGNPADTSILGMLMKEGATPFDDDAWAATFSYKDDGYVSDADATKIKYDKLLAKMKSDTAEENKWRKENGYPSAELIGWAEPPTYLAAAHKMYWAKELNFEGSTGHTLNYDIRVLGRSGVLVVGFIAGMDQLAEIKAATPAVLAASTFDTGARYTDYVKGVDKRAAYGLAALVAGGLIAKKTGLIAAALLFGKKFIVLIVAGFAGVMSYVRRLFGKRPTES